LELSVEDRKHILEKHLTVIFNTKKDRIEIGYVPGCRRRRCPSPRTTLVFYVCPQQPCPGLDGNGS